MSLEQLATDFDPRLRALMVEAIAKLRPFAVGNDSVPALRLREIALITDGTKLLSENAALSKSLTTKVASLTVAASKDITDANTKALSVLRFSTWVLVIAVMLSLVSSTLIVWLYVGRNLIARLKELTDRTMALAAGDLRSPLPQGGADEIGRMAESLAVFRATAVEMEETNLKEIREARTRLTEAIETISEGFSLYSAEDKLIVCNSRYKELFASHADVLMPGTSFETILRTATERGLIKDAEGRREAWIAERLARHRAASETHIQRRSDGRWIQVNERKTANGGVVAIYADITELKQHEAELAEARDAADAANQTKSSFLANMSHELRTPLNAIIGYSEMLQEDAADKGDKAAIDDLQKIEGAGRHLLGLINNILDLSKIEAGKMDVFIEPIDIQAMVKEVLSIVRPLADKNENVVEVVCPADIGSFRSDQTKVKQCLLNLMSNANKFTEQGHADPGGSARGRFAGLLPRVGHRHRHDAGATRPAVRGVQPGGCLDHQALRRHGSWARHHQALLHHAGRRRDGREHARQGLDIHHQTSGSGRRRGRRGVARAAACGGGRARDRAGGGR